MHLGIIGHGAIAHGLLAQLPPGLARVTVLTRTPPARAKDGLAVTTDAGTFAAARPDLVVECAGQEAVRAHVPGLWAQGVDVLIASIGALADADLHATLTKASDTGGRLILPHGAIGGLDLLATLAQAGDLQVSYPGTNPPAAWRGSPAETLVDLGGMTGPTVLFSGTARDTALRFPKKANVVAALALAGAGFDATRAELVADPQATTNRHAYTVASPLARYTVEIEGAATPGNARTSASTVWSLLREVRDWADTRRRSLRAGADTQKP